MAHGMIENSRLRLEFNEPGVHPFVTVLLPAGGGEWAPAALLGARQLRYFHKGASFPRLVADGNEEDTSALFDISGREGGTAVDMSDMRSGLNIETSVELEGESPVVHVMHKLTATADVEVNRVFDRFDYVCAQGEEAVFPDFHYVPHLRPRSDEVISDQVFRSPVVMLEKDGVFFALVPDIDVMQRTYAEGLGRYYFDFQISAGENHCPTVSFGLGHSRVKGHVYFENDFQNEIAIPEGKSVSLGYYLIADRDGFDARQAVAFIWERYGRQHYLAGEPQAAGWDRYASRGLARMFKRGDLFKTFPIEGQTCGGTVGIHLMSKRGVRLMGLAQLQRYLRYQDFVLAVTRKGIEQMSEHPWLERLYERASFRYGPKMPPQVFLQAWFNNLRSAYGAYWFARKWNDHELLERALAVKNLAIMAPREQGAFPAVCYPTEEGVFWSRGTRGFKHFDWYNTADCATTGYYMANWFADHEGDPRLLARCRELASWLMDLQLASGAFPAWAQPSRGAWRVSDELKESATTAAPAMFLARLFQIESDARYLDAVLKACEFLASEVMPRQKWFDFETFFSCSKKRLGLFDENTGTYPQNTMSMYWAAEAFRLAYLVTLDEDFLASGRRVLDQLCLYQQVWSPGFLSINAFGGFGSMNTDAEWNDARQGIIAPVLLDYYRATGHDEYMERGVSALRASFATMFIEENRWVAPGNMRIAIPEETGSVTENYAHFGYDHATPGFLDSDWGAGSSCSAAAYAQKHYGDIYIDLPRGKAFGINGCLVSSFEESGDVVSLGVKVHVETGAELRLRLQDGRPGMRVEVNGRAARPVGPTEYSVLL